MNTKNKSNRQTRDIIVSLPFNTIQKRSGRKVPYDLSRIERAIWRAFQDTKEGSLEESIRIAKKVERDLALIAKISKNSSFLPTVEAVQDIVEDVLMNEGFHTTAKAYILYRQRHAQLRKKKGVLDEQARTHIQEDRKYFTSQYAHFIFYQMYARWRPELKRRESWVEAVDRFMDFMREKMNTLITEKEYARVREYILWQKVCPSMRLLWSAGTACRESNVWAYNCSYIAPVHPRDLGEIMYILMCGAGLGFTVESDNIEQFPQIKKQTGKILSTHIVDDSKEGWADAFVLAMETWYEGSDIDFDFSKIRPAGARLKTAGGRASGPEPLKNLFEFTQSKMFSKQGKRLSSIDLHDIICKIGEIVVAGGVRRSALISLSELKDVAMRDAKQGQFYLTEPQRSLANNSAIYDEKPNAEDFLDEWLALIKSRSGERGIFNRGSILEQVPNRRAEKLKAYSQVGVNPCGEIYLRSKEFCNLTSIVIRSDDTRHSLLEKIEVATLLGTYQSMLTNFKYLSDGWKKNCEDERLLGVSLTGYYDNPVVRDDEVLCDLRDHAVRTNEKYAKRFNINPSAAITCVKPHGNSGQLLGVGSGMHPWFSQYYIRRVRISATDPLFAFAREQGIPYHPEVGQTKEDATTFVLEFPVHAPKNAVTKDSVSAQELLHEWKRLKENFVEHNPSVTIYVSSREWIDVAHFVYEHWDSVGGLSFLPRTDHVYKLAPYEEITEEEYERRCRELGEIDFSKLPRYEEGDTTTGGKEFACVGGTCEI